VRSGALAAGPGISSSIRLAARLKKRLDRSNCVIVKYNSTTQGPGLLDFDSTDKFRTDRSKRRFTKAEENENEYETPSFQAVDCADAVHHRSLRPVGRAKVDGSVRSAKVV